MRSIKATYQPISWLGDRVRLLDQTRLPGEEVFLDLDDYREIGAAINELKIRGAPAIGIAGAYAVALGALKIIDADKIKFFEKFEEIIAFIAATRPTARNLFSALERLKKCAVKQKTVPYIKQALVAEAIKINRDETEATVRISHYGAGLVKDGWTILTHCNTGPLATSGEGTALGVIIKAHQLGKNVKVLVTETRPLLQGSRLTTWELMKAGVPFTLITDSMAGHFMKLGKVDCVIVGADRIAANGDTANKIGTYMLAVLARENHVPFYVAAPISTMDISLNDGNEIPIEERRPEEVIRIRGIDIAPQGVAAANPAFDVTPRRYITALITDKGIINKPNAGRIKVLFRRR